MSDLFGAPGFIPAIGLWQPWASLCFTADPSLRKMLETRNRRPPLKYVGGHILIQATVAWPAAKLISESLHELARAAFGSAYKATLPRGSLIGSVTLSGGVRTEDIRDTLDAVQLAAGDYGDGRFAWPLSDPRPFPQPVPAKGKQGWWHFPASALPQQDPRP